MNGLISVNITPSSPDTFASLNSEKVMDNKKVADKIALVTGGSRGLGKDMALQLAEKGIHVILTYHSKKDEALGVVKEIQGKGLKAAALHLNVEDSKTFDNFFRQVSTTLKDSFGTTTLNYLVNNAGTGVYAPFSETSEDQFDSMVNIHFKATYFLSQKALPLIADGGGIVNISSGLARFSFAGYSAYGSMKGAIETLTKYQALELGPRKIRINVVAPGAIETDFGGGAVRDNADLNKMIASQTALGRTGVPGDIGGVVAFLCTDEAKWINGQRIEVAGGIHL
jgi:NAD(P)-dependent dehydrogenase (short-subunit alcohol dehydrogenase family)